MVSPCSLLSRRIAIAALLSVSTIVSAQGPVTGRPYQLQPVRPDRMTIEPLDDGIGAFEALRRGRNGATIFGIVQNHLGELVPTAGTVFIRSLVDGTVAGQAQVDELAQFTLRGFDPGLYTAELVGPAGGVLATSNAFSAGVGEVIQLAPVIPVAPVSGLASMLGNATSTAVTSAAGAGVMAVAPGEPVSPQ